MAGKFEYQKKYDVNVCKQETSLFSDNMKNYEVQRLTDIQQVYMQRGTVNKTFQILPFVAARGKIYS